MSNARRKIRRRGASATNAVPHRQSRRRWARRVAVAAGVAALAIWLVQREPEHPEIPGGVPSLLVTPASVDLGDRPTGEWVNVSLEVRNAGTGVLRFRLPPWVTVVEGCCPPTATIGSMVLNPGERTTVDMRFTMHPGMDGPHDFRVHFATDDPAAPDRVVQVLSNWIVPSGD